MSLYEAGFGAARALTPSFRKKHSEIPWKKIVGMRNIIMHDYFQIDQKIVWSVVVTELPKLKASIQKIRCPIPFNSQKEKLKT